MRRGEKGIGRREREREESVILCRRAGKRKQKEEKQQAK